MAIRSSWCFSAGHGLQTGLCRILGNKSSRKLGLYQLSGQLSIFTKFYSSMNDKNNMNFSRFSFLKLKYNDIMAPFPFSSTTPTSLSGFRPIFTSASRNTWVLGVLPQRGCSQQQVQNSGLQTAVEFTSTSGILCYDPALPIFFVLNSLFFPLLAEFQKRKPMHRVLACLFLKQGLPKQNPTAWNMLNSPDWTQVPILLHEKPEKSLAPSAL